MNSFRWMTTAACLGVIPLMLAGCGPTSQGDGQGKGKKDDGKIQIVATCSMVADIVRQVAGEHANVESLMGEGVDPHTYKPTRDDIKKINDADVVFYSGIHLEAQFESEFKKLSDDGKPTHAVGEAVDHEDLRSPPEFEGQHDPHVWMNVAHWSKAVGLVADKLAEHDKEHADDYQANAKAYQDELSKLDAYVKKVIASIPESQRVLVTAHDAFGYFSEAYEIEVNSVQGISTESEASLKDVNQLRDFIIERKIKAVFVEDSVNNKNVVSLIAGARSEGHEVVEGGTLFSDAMGESGTYEGTYIGMMDHNATVIARALGGEAPEKGMNGKLKTGSE